MTLFDRITGREPKQPITTVRVHARKVLVAMVIAIVMLTLLSTAAGAVHFFNNFQEGSFGFQVVKLFWLDTEQNIPTLYQTMALFGAAALLFLVARESHSTMHADVLRWRTLGLMFCVLGIDEGASLHEFDGLYEFDVYAEHFFLPPTAIFLPAVAMLGLWFLPLLRRIDRGTSFLIVVSGTIYVGGAVCVELVGQLYALSASKVTVLYAALATIEEVCEMLGIALFIFAILDYLGQLQNSRND